MRSACDSTRRNVAERTHLALSRDAMDACGMNRELQSELCSRQGSVGYGARQPSRRNRDTRRRPKSRGRFPQDGARHPTRLLSETLWVRWGVVPGSVLRDSPVDLRSPAVRRIVRDRCLAPYPTEPCRTDAPGTLQGCHGRLLDEPRARVGAGAARQGSVGYGARQPSRRNRDTRRRPKRRGRFPQDGARHHSVQVSGS
jgi:hypothetical protein